MISLEIVRCESNGCPYILDLGEPEDRLIVGDSDTREFVTRTPKEVSAWLSAVARDQAIEQPPLAPHDGEDFYVNNGTLYIPTANYGPFVGSVVSGKQFQQYLSQQAIAA